jgi:signal transduction histidine kinase
VTALALSVAAASLGFGLLVAYVLRRAPVLLQLAGLAFASVGVPLTAVLLSGWVMLEMGADAKILAIAIGAAAAAVVAGFVLTQSLTRSVRRVVATSERFAAGDFSARAPLEGPPEIAALAASFNTMASSVEGLFDARRELVAWASHDLRTPLSSLQAMIEAIEDGLVEPEHYLPSLHEQVRALSALVDDLFELARLDSGALTLEVREIAVHDLVESALRLLGPEAASRRIALQAHLDGDTSTIVAAEKIERVLFNLLTNALRHTPSDGAVAVYVDRLETDVLFSVEDTGDGLAGDTPARMFERFWRGDPARSESGGGLGLAIARGLVEAHGGRIWAENREEGGARVSFTLPAAPATVPPLADGLSRA